MIAFSAQNAAVKRPKTAFVVLGVALYAMFLPALALVLATGVPPLGVFMLHSLLFGTFALSYGYRSNRNAKFVPGTLTVDGENVRLDGRVLAARAELTQGFVVPAREGTLVRLERGALRPGVVVRVRDEAEAVGLLRALGFDAEHAAAEMRAASGLLALSVPKQMAIMLPGVLACLAGIFWATATFQKQAGPYVMAIVTMLLVWTFTLAFAPTTIRIGTDGVVTRWLGRERFVRFTEIERAERYDEIVGTKRQCGVRLHLRGGEPVRLPTGQTEIGESESRQLLTRIEEARAARDAGHVASAAAFLSRGTKNALDWVRSLRALGSGALDLRTSAVPTEVLLKTVEDGGSSETERAGAAVAALASRESRDVAARIRVAAETAASPKLRVALDRLADEPTDEDAAKILAELDDRAING